MEGILTTATDIVADERTDGIPGSHLWMRRIALLSAGVLTFMLIAWVLTDPIENLATDWTAFDTTADRVFAGEDLYRPYEATSEPLPYLYPPYALWLVLPLAALGFTGSFLFSALLSAGSLVAGVVAMARSELRQVDKATGVIVGLASGAALSSVLIGQYSGLYALAIGGAAVAFSTDRRGAAGAFLALLWIKPNLAVAVPVVLLWSRSWRVLASFAISSTALFASSLVFGVGQWAGFLANAQMMAELQEEGIVPFRKMVTMLGSVQTVLNVETAGPGLLLFWVVTSGFLGVAVLQLWSRDALAASPSRAFGALALFVVAANPRLYFYDATLVVVGVLGIWMAAQAMSSPRVRAAMSWLALLAWLSLWGGVFVPLNVLVGPVSGAILLVSALDHRFGEVRPAERPDRVGANRPR